MQMPKIACSQLLEVVQLFPGAKGPVSHQHPLLVIKERGYQRTSPLRLPHFPQTFSFPCNRGSSAVSWPCLNTWGDLWGYTVRKLLLSTPWSNKTHWNPYMFWVRTKHLRIYFKECKVVSLLQAKKIHFPLGLSLICISIKINQSGQISMFWNANALKT